MGQTSSNFAKKVVSPFSGWGSECESKKRKAVGLDNSAVTPFVYKRRSSMYFDEDGDLAHEFYEEVQINRNTHKTTMRRNYTNLRPEGEIELPHPRLSVDFPIIMCEVTKS
ncbi:hypothetical protein NP493_885g00000 [Ridgeia piscesae]|uniref:Tumor suppressor candidate 2 n=1 Tax=Ridgeia piscesae TaxID=27915 RepID=A0AAD9NLT4_RIDPI|nr:hypothetical protein NP493_885g00000 [Ridgeia piscesae]